MNCFIVYLYDFAKYKRKTKKRSNISIVLLYVFHVNQVIAEWPLQGNCKSGPSALSFYHLSLKGPQLSHLTMLTVEWYHLKISLHTGKLCFWPPECCCCAFLLFFAVKKIKLYDFFRYNQYLKPIMIRIRVRCIGYDRFILKNKHLKKVTQLVFIPL